jgi:ribbon-helix-helix CopG family protein
MARPAGEPRVRLNLDLTVSVRKQLEQLKDRTGAESLSEVLRRALELYDRMDGQVRDGWKVMLVGPGGEQREVVIL